MRPCLRDPRSGAALAAMLFAGAALQAPDLARATPPGLLPEDEADGYRADIRSHAIEAYLPERGYRARVEDAQLRRNRALRLPPGILAVQPIVGTAVAGRVEVPVVLVTFSDTPGPPYSSARLAEQLFEGPNPTGTMTEHYHEMSGGHLEVTGSVLDWQALTETRRHYAGPDGCTGRCLDGKMGALVIESLDLVDEEIDFARFDNDGPDGRPNSGDDDGFVDFVAFVHPDFGAECGGIGSHQRIWSHRFSVSGWTGTTHATADDGTLGPKIRVDDYVVMPALACDGSSVIDIGVFSHEFGHAFGLPDLYDSAGASQTQGVGKWGLMASGSWGGSAINTPETPTHMGAWSKEFLGWVSPNVVETDTAGVTINPYVSTGDVVRVDYSDLQDPEDTRYLLLTYRTKEGFDASLAGEGLLVTEVMNTVVSGGLANNSVNGDPNALGIDIVEADGLGDLERSARPTDAMLKGDPFPGSADVREIGAAHPEGIRAALCAIEDHGTHVTLDIFTSRTTCPGSIAGAAVAVRDIEDAEIGSEVVVRGVIRNEGANLFTDRKLVIETPDGGSSKIVVTAPLAFSAAEAPFDIDEGGDPAPAVLPDILDQPVVIRGRVRRDVVRGIGETDVLVIEEYELVQ